MAEEYQLAAKITGDASQLNSEVDKISQKINQLKETQKIFVEQFGEASPQVAELNRMIASLEQQLTDANTQAAELSGELQELSNVPSVEIPVEIGEVPMPDLEDVPPYEIDVTIGEVPMPEVGDIPPVEIEAILSEIPMPEIGDIPPVEIPMDFVPPENPPELPTESVKTLKAQLKEAKLELEQMVGKFGLGSKEAAEAAKKVANLTDEIGDAKALTEAFNPDAKFAAFGQALQGVVGGISAVTGGMAIFGEKGKDVQEVLAKVQGAMALSQGINSVLAAKDSFINLGSVIKNATISQKAYSLATAGAAAVQRLFTGAVATTSTGFKLLRGAIISTGIGALIVGVGLLIDAITSWISSTSDAEEANAALEQQEKSLDSAMEKTNETIKGRNEALEFLNKLTISQAKAAGKSAEEIRTIERTQRKKAIELAQKDLEYAQKQQEQQIASAKEQLKKAQSDGDEDEIKQAQEKYDTILKKVTDFTKERKSILVKAQRDNVLAEAEYAEKDAEEKRKKEEADKKEAENKAKERKQKRDQEAKEIADATKASGENVRKLEQESFLLTIKDDNERAKVKLKQDLENAIRDVNQTKATKEQKQKEITALQNKFALDEAALDEQIKKDKDEKELAAIEEFSKASSDLANQINLANMKAGFEKEKAELNLQYQSRRDEIDKNEKLNAQQKLFLKQQLAVKEKQELDKLEEQQKLKDLEKAITAQEALINDEKVKYDKKVEAVAKEKELYDKALADKIISEEEHKQKLKLLSEAKVKIDEAEKKAKIDNAQKVASALSGLSELFGKETAAGKATAVAAATINTYLAASQALTGIKKMNPFGAAMAIAQAAMVIGTGIKNVKEILKVKVPGSGGGSSPSIPTSTMAPMTPQLGGTMINQGQLNSMAENQAAALQQQPLRAYVVERDMRNTTDRVNRIERAATIG